MFQLLVLVGRHDLALRQVPAFTISFVIAATLYRFGSFALECLAFLATWFVIDGVAQLFVAFRRRLSVPVAEPISHQ
jgi:hypothetical protein